MGGDRIAPASAVQVLRARTLGMHRANPAGPSGLVKSFTGVKAAAYAGYV